MSFRGELRVERNAAGDSARALRHALASFMQAAEIAPERIDDIVTAVGEAIANAIEHAYAQSDRGVIELVAKLADHDRVEVAVTDHGTFVERPERPGRGFGLRIVRQIACDVSIDTARGTTVRMTFDAPHKGAAEG
jgi:anti-sigma regulatory factor (Ser/Thr protein kinase)